MNALSWMQRKFKQNNDEQSRNVSTGKSCSCFSAIWGLHEQQHNPEEKNLSTHFSQPRVCSESSVALNANSVQEVHHQETIDMSMDFFHTFLAIGTLGSISTTEESITPILEVVAKENELQSLNNIEKLNENQLHGISNDSPKGKVLTLNEKEIKGMDTIVKESMARCTPKECSEMTPTKEEIRKQKRVHVNLFKKSETHAMHFMKKMLKNLDFTRCISPTSTNICDSTEKKATLVFRKSGKIHPEAANIHVTKSHSYEIKHMCYDKDINDKQVTLDDGGNTHPNDEMLKKEIVSCYPTGEKAHWIKTDADYFVLEF